MRRYFLGINDCNEKNLLYFIGSFFKNFAFKAFLSSMAPNHAPLLNGLRQYLHRMVICLENELLPHLPAVLQKFLTFVTDLKSLTDFLTLVQQAVAKYKVGIT